LLRLSALGDVCHTIPIVRTIQHAWPNTRLTWVIGKVEHGLVYDMPGIEFVVLDKSQGIRGYAELRRRLRGRRFGALLHMQVSLRASLASLFISSPIRLGFDRERAKDFQWLFTNRRIPARAEQHVMDGLFGFVDWLGIREHLLAWDIPIPPADLAYADTAVGTDVPVLVISPCASANYRDWSVPGYVAVADYAARRYGMRVVLTGAPGDYEREMGRQIVALAECGPLNLIGRTTLKQLLAVFKRARLVIAPDSGPAHMATAVGTPVIGLYATSNPDRTGPYFSRDLVVNEYPAALRAKYGRTIAQMPWGQRVRDTGTMDRINVKSVVEKLDLAMHRSPSYRS
jgi:heptosyltransferase I